MFSLPTLRILISFFSFLCHPAIEGVVQDFRERATRAHITAAYAIPLSSRFTLDLLGYVPTYTSYLKKKSRQQGVPRAGQGRGKGRGRGGRGGGEGSGGGVSTPEAEGSISGPRGIIREEIDRETPKWIGLSGEMAGRRTRAMLNLRHQRPRGCGVGSPPGTVGARSSRVAPTSPDEPAEKRARHEVGDSCQAKDKETIIIPEEDEGQGDGTGGEDTDAKTRTRARESHGLPSSATTLDA